MTIKAVIFDLDGVITDTAQYHYIAWKQLAASLGIEFGIEDNERIKGLSRMASLDIILGMGQMPLNEPGRLKLAEVKNQHYLTLIETMSAEDILPGTERVLAKLKQKNYKIGLASASKNALKVLDKLGLSAQFDYIADAHSVENSKPHREVFLKVATALNVSPNECVAVEDAVAGVEAIKRAGMYAVGIGCEKVLYDANVVLEGLNEFNLEDIIARTNVTA
jgi:beta-phosphoglucomutase